MVVVHLLGSIFILYEKRGDCIDALLRDDNRQGVDHHAEIVGKLLLLHDHRPVAVVRDVLERTVITEDNHVEVFAHIGGVEQ